jgi:hypothetical protein
MGATNKEKKVNKISTPVSLATEVSIIIFMRRMKVACNWWK